MSDNKFKFYQVVLTQVVRANSQNDAISLLFGEDSAGELLSQEIDVERISATLAHELSA